MRHWTFLDFTDPNGKSEIQKWLKGLPANVRMRIHSEIRALEACAELGRPAVGWLQRECKGLLELRIKVDRVQYRPIGYRGPGEKEITLLIGAKEKGRRFDPEDACITAFNRVRTISLTNRSRICEHRFD